MKRILWINPLGTDEFDVPISEALASEAPVELDVVSLSAGPRNLDFDTSAAACAVETLSLVRWAEREQYDAAIIGCFYDPYLRAAREITTRMVVTAPAEASLRIAATIGESYSILVGGRKNIPEMHDNVVRYGHQNRLASFRTLDIGVNEYQQDLAHTRARIFEESEAAVQSDRADVVVFGCTAQFGIYKEVQEHLGVPVLDSAVAALQYANFLASIESDQGWGVSRASGYGRPPKEDLDWIPIAEPGNVIKGVRA